MPNSSADDILKKYGRKLQNEINTEQTYQQQSGQDFSSEYVKFKSDMMPSLSKYENLAKAFGRMLQVKLSSKDSENITKKINTAHLDLNPSDVVSAAFLSAIIGFFGGVLLCIALWLLEFTSSFPLLLFFLFLVSAIFIFFYLYSMPERLATKWRLKASSQMIPCILYTVVYMKHTSNLERAINFASKHLDPPLSLDLRKVFWDVETGKYSTIKESLDNYLETWRESSSEFVESFNLIESSLYEPSEARRVEILEKSLQVILDGVYDKMLKFSHSVKSPLTNIYMIGIVLPTLGLALIPLGSTLLNGAFKWYHIFVLFNLIIPFFVFYMTTEIMSKRPGGYGESSLLELNPLYEKYKSKKPYIKAALICIPILLIGLLPFIIHLSPVSSYLDSTFGWTNGDLSFKDIKLFGFISDENGKTINGPMGPLALLFSLLVPLAILLFFAISYLGKTNEIIKSRDYTKKLENEFNNSLFQLGNRIGDGMPAEMAFGKVAESSRGQITEDFFRMVNLNIQSQGMNLERAIFDNRRGAILNYSSNLIATSMHILIESVKKGLLVCAQSLMSISEYIKNINKINDRLRDLLADVVSDMKSNMVFLAPLLSGIVVGLSSMITLILSKLSLIQDMGGADTATSMVNLGSFTELFDVSVMIPPYFLQVCVGIYIIEVIFILTKALVTVDAGEDELKETYDIGKNLLAGGVLYLVVAFIAILALSLLAAFVIPGLS
jgi:hypothetical protein